MTIEKSEDTKICVLCLYGYVLASIAVISLLMIIFLNKANLVENLIFSPTTFLLGPSIPPLAGLLPPVLLIGSIAGTVMGHHIGRKLGKHDFYVLISSAFWGAFLPITFLLLGLATPEF